MDYQFRGWIPVVAGRLSFRLVGNTSNPAPCDAVNVPWHGGGLVIASQARSFAVDLLLGQAGLKTQRKNTETTDCIFLCVAHWVASPDKYAPLVGQVAMLAKCHWAEFEAAFIDIQQEVDAATRARAGVDPDSVQQACSILDRASVCADFKLTRAGELELNLRSHAIYEESAKRLSSDPAYADMLRQGVASQLYFFLRDITHHHKHHDPKSDALLDVSPLEPSKPQEWRQDVAVALWRTAVSLRRGTNGSAAGFVAYALAFREICNRANACPPIYQVILADPLLKSIDAQSASTMHHFASQEARSDFFLQTWVATSALLIGALALLQLQSEHFNQFRHAMPAFLAVGELTLEYPYLGLPALLGIAFLLARELTKWRATFLQSNAEIKLSRLKRIYLALMAPSKWKQEAIGVIALLVGTLAVLLPFIAAKVLRIPW